MGPLLHLVAVGEVEEAEEEAGACCILTPHLFVKQNRRGRRRRGAF